MKEFIILCIACALFNVTCTNPDRDHSNNSSLESKHDKFTAYKHASNFVRQQLKFPRTAEFPDAVEKEGHITDQGRGVFVIDSWFYSQNSYGATLRKNFSCKITFAVGTIVCNHLIIQR